MIKKKIKKVGDVKKIVPKKNRITGKISHAKYFYTYNDVEYDADGWADCNKYLPDDFHLVFMRLEREKTIPGWISGGFWHGLRLKNDDEVLFWKKKQERDGSTYE